MQTAKSGRPMQETWPKEMESTGMHKTQTLMMLMQIHGRIISGKCRFLTWKCC